MTRAGRSALRAALLGAGLSAGAASAAELRVTDEAGRALIAVPLAAEGRWCLVWNHSVTGDEVRDCFRTRGGAMFLERSHQIDLSAAGLGHIPGRGRIVPDGAGGQWIEEIDAEMPPSGLPLRVGAARVDHRLVVGGETRSLSALAAGRRVTISLSDTGT